MDKPTTSIKVVVLHEYYGCDTGCCGHVVRLNDEDGDEIQFDFDHPYNEDKRMWAIKFAQQAVEEQYDKYHIADLDWDNCVVDC